MVWLARDADHRRHGHSARTAVRCGTQADGSRRRSRPDAPQPLRSPFEASRAGVGLAVARGFTEAIGGTLTAEDSPGGGFTMVITLPMAGDVPSVSPELPMSAVT
ncbi:ATP-binding protein [Streptomyces goshikiensis]